MESRRVRNRGDVLPERCGQPGAVTRFGIDEKHHPERAVAIKRMLGVRPDHDAAALTPSLVFAADGDASVERDDDLNRVVCVGRDDSPSSGGEEEAALPQIPARDAQPAIWLLVRGVRQARILPAPPAAGVLFKNAEFVLYPGGQPRLRPASRCRWM